MHVVLLDKERKKALLASLYLDVIAITNKDCLQKNEKKNP
jgi:hypothetical protein